MMLSWAKDLKMGCSLINARSATVAEQPSFRFAFKKRRCLVPADGIYEWNSSVRSNSRGGGVNESATNWRVRVAASPARF